MRTRDLARELDAAIGALGEPGRQRLVGLGIAPELLAPPLAMVGLARIRVDGDRYQPDPAGGVAYVTPVLVGNPVSPEAAEPGRSVRQSGELIDLVAWRDDRMDTIATRAGTASWLGAIEPQYLAPAPVSVWRHPLGWLRAGCRGLVLLTRDPVEAWLTLADCRGGIIAEDEAHARELRRALERPWPVPEVKSRRGVGARHAA